MYFPAKPGFVVRYICIDDKAGGYMLSLFTSTNGKKTTSSLPNVFLTRTTVSLADCVFCIFGLVLFLCGGRSEYGTYVNF